MKRITATFSALLVIAFTATTTFAAESVHIMMKCQGKTVSPTRCVDGTCTFDGVKPGDCTISLVDEHGNPVSSGYKLQMTWTVSSPRDVATGQASGRSSVSTTTTTSGTVSTTGSVVSPRDAASGLPTGKRMHKPITITKEWGASSPQLRVATPACKDCDDSDTWSVSINFTKIEMK